MTKEIAADLIKRGEKARGVRSGLLTYWQEIAENYYPERADFNHGISFGEEFGQNLFDEGPVVMRRDLCNSFATMLRPRGQRWFKPTVIDEDLRDEAGVADWLEMAGNVMWRWMYAAKSSFIRSMKTSDHDFGTFGNAVLSVEPRMEGAGLVYRAYHLRDTWWLENADGTIDTVWREIQMTARQIKQRWPKATLHEDITKALESNPEQEFCVWHVMMPVADYERYGDTKTKTIRRNKQRFVSCYLDKAHSDFINCDGSHEFRYVIPRWQPVSGWAYAVSPATSDSLPGARMLQVMARTGLEALEKSIDPPHTATEEAIRGDINLFAGGTTWVDRSYDEKTGPALQLFDVGKNAILGLQALDQTRMRLGDSMYINKLSINTGQAKTAYETQQLVEEYIRAAVPLFEPLEEEYNAKVLDETFGLLMRVGAFGPIDDMPDALQGADFEWSFANPLQEAKERVKVSTFQTSVELTLLGKQIEPTLGADLDVREAYRDALRGAGSPESWVKDKDEADEDAEAQAAAAEAMQAVNAAGMAGQAAGAVGDGMQKMMGVPA